MFYLNQIKIFVKKHFGKLWFPIENSVEIQMAIILCLPCYCTTMRLNNYSVCLLFPSTPYAKDSLKKIEVRFW